MVKKKTTDGGKKRLKSALAKDSPMPPKKKEASPSVFPIIGLGASAGGLEALKAFFGKVVKHSGLAYIVVVHMTPKQPSMLGQLLQKITPVPVLNAEDGLTILPDHIYVIPPSKEIAVYQGRIQLLEPVSKTIALPIDLLLRSLAQDKGENAAGIILSGTGTDGTLGIKEIKANDGLVIVQDEASAGYDGMPRSAISTGLADMILPPQEMFSRLAQYFSNPTTALAKKSFAEAEKEFHQEWLKKIFAILRVQTGHDFSSYKVNTMLRRISRRMGLNQIVEPEKYVRFLREHTLEVEALFRELLIGVTNFFRDKESFEVLKTEILPELFKQIREDSTFRAWIPGCSTGEEVYSLAMVLCECLDKTMERINIQLFGTDIDSYAIDKAREGIFPASIAADVSSERLKRFFTKEGDFFRIRKKIRDYAVFSVQDVLKDPPFSRLQMLCCRNLLIYLDAEAQKRLLPLFHYTLTPGGILMLGSSETIGSFSNLFEAVDKKWKIFKRREVPRAMRQIVDFPSGTLSQDNTNGGAGGQPKPKADIAVLTQQALLKQFVPTAVLVDGKGEILHIQGRTGKYLEVSSGPPTFNILDMAREGLRIELSSAIRTAKNTDGNIVRRKISVKTNGNMQMINLHIYPQRSPKELAGRILVVFEDIDIAERTAGAVPAADEEIFSETSRIAELERELQNTRESHQTTIEELESSNEELKSTNEELQSSNEELQSTNEELESSKEELQSLNEELQTVNAELQSKVEELSAAHDDMHNLLNSTEIATIFVDNDMRVRRFTPEAVTIINLIQADIGRPLQHVVNNLAYDGMIEDLTDVLKKLTSREVEVRTQKGNWYNMRIMPYRTTDNRIDGAVLTFSDIADQKRAQSVLKKTIPEIKQVRDLLRTVFDLNPDPMLVAEEDGKMVIVNCAFSKLVNIGQEDIEGLCLFDLKNEMLQEMLRKSELKEYLLQENEFRTAPFEMERSRGKTRLLIHGVIIKANNASKKRIVLKLIKMNSTP